MLPVGAPHLIVTISADAEDGSIAGAANSAAIAIAADTGERSDTGGAYAAGSRAAVDRRISRTKVNPFLFDTVRPPLVGAASVAAAFDGDD
jgi:hypothetical protein